MGLITYLFAIFCVITLIKAMPWDGAPSTSISSSPGWNLKPTPAPTGAGTALMGSNDLRRRQARGSICGYRTGQSDLPISCPGFVFTVCTPIPSVSAIGCCRDWGGNQCVIRTDCIGYYDYLKLCSGSSVPCPLNDQTVTCISELPYCERYTQSGYSYHYCNTYPSVYAISMTFFPSSSSTAITLTSSDCPKNNCNPVSPGTIAGSVVGGLFILVAGAVGVAFMLRQRRHTPRTSQLGVMEESKSVGPPGSRAPLDGQFPQPPIVGPDQLGY
ncbi:hypothetical protein BDD12DRAFT_841503 [Trichophaea hybrida]|nr:hypothetical protein BDD12DRAFT_841503 [Trichophaea hybrida]